MEILGVAFCGPCARQQEAYFSICELTHDDGRDLHSKTLAEVLEGSDLTAGDFVRWVRQVADFAGQIADAAGPGDLRDTARLLVRSMRRGVVSYAPEVDADEGDDLTGADLP